MTDLKSAIKDVLPDAIRIRHDLHAHPELGYAEHRTSQVVQRELTSCSIEFRAGLAGGTGVLAYLPATQPDGQVIAMRADMDALPIEEQTGLSYASETPGTMHACGHDGHTAILLTAAKVLAKTENRPNDVLFIFQPAEEGGGGGKRMCAEGALNGTLLGRSADVIFGLHGDPRHHSGDVSTRVGTLMASASEFSIRVVGKGTHAAMPHLGIDPILISAHIVTAMQSIVARNVDPMDSVVVTVGVITAGVAHNVIPEYATMRGTLRTLSGAMKTYAMAQVEQIAKGVALSFGGTATVEWHMDYPPTVNHEAPTEYFRRLAQNVLGKEHVHNESTPTMGAEDFSFYGHHIPACFFWLGLMPADEQTYANLHAPTFDFNDDSIPVGVQIFCELALAPVR